MVDCIQLWPFPTCGLNADCVDLANASSSFCECKKGWEQSLDWNFFVENESQLIFTPCHVNNDIINGLYGLLIFLSLFDTILQCLVSRNYMKKKLWKRKFMLLFNLSVFCLSVYKLSNSEDAKFGFDFTFTFLITISGTLSIIHSYVILDKYLKYISHKASSIVATSRKGLYVRAKRTRKIYTALNILCVAALPCVWLIIWLNNDDSLVVIRVVFMIEAFRIAFEATFLYVSSSEVISDIEKLISIDMNYLSVDVSKNGSDILEQLRKEVRKLKGMKFGGTVERCVEIMLLVTILSDAAVLAWAYMVPIFCCSIYANSLLGVISKWHHSFKKAASTSSNKSARSSDD